MPRWRNLKGFQKLYVIAALSVAINLPVAVVLTLVALTVDFWPRFAKLWDTLAGKALVLIFYAATTNFVVAAAATLVNSLTGLDASYFPYAHYTAILLSLPAWVFGLSLAVLVLLQLIFPLFILVVLGLRLLGIRSTTLFKDIAYPILTMCLRFALSILLVVQGVYFLDHNEEDEVLSSSNQEPTTSSTDEAALADSKKQSDVEQEGTKIRISVDEEILKEEEGYIASMRLILAHFIFYVEANSRSRCELVGKTRSIELNEYQHVEIRRDKSQPNGYAFTVKACKSPGIPKA